MTPFELQLRRDLSLGWAGRGDMLVVLGFFLIIVTLFPLALGPDPAQLRMIAVPVIWVAAMLACLSGFTRIFAEDVRCGWVDQVALSPMPLPLYALAKAVGSLGSDGAADHRGAAAGDDAESRGRHDGAVDAGAGAWHRGADAPRRDRRRPVRGRARRQRADGRCWCCRWRCRC